MVQPLERQLQLGHHPLPVPVQRLLDREQERQRPDPLPELWHRQLSDLFHERKGFDNERRKIGVGRFGMAEGFIG